MSGYGKIHKKWPKFGSNLYNFHRICHFWRPENIISHNSMSKFSNNRTPPPTIKMEEYPLFHPHPTLLPALVQRSGIASLISYNFFLFRGHPGLNNNKPGMNIKVEPPDHLRSSPSLPLHPFSPHTTPYQAARHKELMDQALIPGGPMSKRARVDGHTDGWQ